MCVHFPSLDLLYAHEAAMGTVWQSDVCIFLFLWHRHPRLHSLVTEWDVCEFCSACFLWHSHLLLLPAGMRDKSSPHPLSLG